MKSNSRIHPIILLGQDIPMNSLKGTEIPKLTYEHPSISATILNFFNRSLFSKPLSNFHIQISGLDITRPE